MSTWAEPADSPEMLLWMLRMLPRENPDAALTLDTCAARAGASASADAVIPDSTVATGAFDGEPVAVTAVSAACVPELVKALPLPREPVATCAADAGSAPGGRANSAPGGDAVSSTMAGAPKCGAPLAGAKAL